MDKVAREVFTIGHSTHEAEQFVKLLAQHGVRAVADVRRFPGSRRNPQFGQLELESSLNAAGISYEALGSELGGRRRLLHGSPSSAWRVDGFRAYADHMASAEFAAGLELLERLACENRTTVMCAEADFHRCHRRLIADALLVRGWRVRHIRPDGAAEDHKLTSFAIVEKGQVSYPAAGEEQQPLK